MFGFYFLPKELEWILFYAFSAFVRHFGNVSKIEKVCLFLPAHTKKLYILLFGKKFLSVEIIQIFKRLFGFLLS